MTLPRQMVLNTYVEVIVRIYQLQESVVAMVISPHPHYPSHEGMNEDENGKIKFVGRMLIFVLSFRSILPDDNW